MCTDIVFEAVCLLREDLDEAGEEIAELASRECSCSLDDLVRAFAREWDDLVQFEFSRDTEYRLRFRLEAEEVWSAEDVFGSRFGGAVKGLSANPAPDAGAIASKVKPESLRGKLTLSGCEVLGVIEPKRAPRWADVALRLEPVLRKKIGG